MKKASHLLFKNTMHLITNSLPQMAAQFIFVELPSTSHNTILSDTREPIYPASSIIFLPKLEFKIQLHDYNSSSTIAQSTYETNFLVKDFDYSRTPHISNTHGTRLRLKFKKRSILPGYVSNQDALLRDFKTNLRWLPLNCWSFYVLQYMYGNFLLNLFSLTTTANNIFLHPHQIVYVRISSNPVCI